MVNSHRAYWLTLVTILCWGGAASAFKIALQTLTPSSLLALAALVSLAVITGLMFMGGYWRELSSLEARHWLVLIVLGMLNPFIYYVILFEAYDRLPGQVAMSLNYLWPVMLALLSVPLLQHRLSRTSLVSILVSFAGALLIASRGQFEGWQALDPLGLVLVLLSTLVWALYWLLSARIQVPAAIKLWVGFGSGTLLAWVYFWFNAPQRLPWDSLPWLAVGYVGVLEMGVTFFIWLKALQLAPSAARIGNLIYLTPFVSLMMLALILEEAIYPSTILGLAIVVAGILLQQTDRQREI